MRNPVGQLAAGIVQCAIPARKDYWPRDRFAKFFWAKQPLTYRNVQFSLGGQCWAKMCKSGEEGDPSFSRLRNLGLAKVETGPRLARLAIGQLKASKSMKCMVTPSDSRSDKQCMQKMNGRLKKHINMHVGEAIYELGKCSCKTISRMRQQ